MNESPVAAESLDAPGHASSRASAGDAAVRGAIAARTEAERPGAAPRYFKHPQALVESSRIGAGTRIWAFAHVLPGATIGAECNICDGVFIENDVLIGDRVTIKCGVQVWDGLVLENDVFVGPNATFTNDHFPRSGNSDFQLLRTTVKRGASIGANATILPGVTIGQHAMVGAGAVVTTDIAPNAIVVGNPARVVGYAAADTSHSASAARESDADTLLNASGAFLRRVPQLTDVRGSLTFVEAGAQLPFEPKRLFTITGVPTTASRGGHAHRAAQEFVMCVNGSCRMVVDDGTTRDDVLLDAPDVGLYIPPALWRTMYRFSPGAVMLVLSSEIYSEEDYVRDYEQVGPHREPR